MGFVRGVVGIITLLFIAFLLSRDRKHIDWKGVVKGLFLQLILVGAVWHFPFVQSLLSLLSRGVVSLLSFAQDGTGFLFGGLLDADRSLASIFAFRVFPSIIFFSALINLAYYWGIVQRIIIFFSGCLKRFFHLSGAEGAVVSANLFVGIGEAPMVIKEFLSKMTSSEMFLLMTAGMSTVACGAMAGYIGVLGGDDPVAQLFFTKHLITASVIALPGAVIISKIIYPQHETVGDDLQISSSQIGLNVLDALTKGAFQGLKLATMIAATLLVFISLTALVNRLFVECLGIPLGLNDWVARTFDGRFKAFDFQFVLGLLFSPLAWITGVVSDDMLYVGQLLGEKLVMNEFVSYRTLADLHLTSVFAEEKSFVMAIYLLCSFANIGSMAILISGVGTLSEKHRPFLTRYSFPALIAGTLVPCLSAAMVGIFL